MNRTEVLEEASKIINGSRQENYGNPESNFTRIAKYWSTYLDKDITPGDVAILMILMKAARLQNNPQHEDSWIDIAGYAANGAEVSI